MTQRVGIVLLNSPLGRVVAVGRGGDQCFRGSIEWTGGRGDLQHPQLDQGGRVAQPNRVSQKLPNCARVALRTAIPVSRHIERDGGMHTQLADVLAHGLQRRYGDV